MAPDCWNGEPVTCGPSVQTVSPCGNILVGHLFMPQFSPQFDIPVSPPVSKPHRAIIIFNRTERCRWTQLKGKNKKLLHAAFIDKHHWPRLSCLLATFTLASKCCHHPVYPCFPPRMICHLRLLEMGQLLFDIFKDIIVGNTLTVFSFCLIFLERGEIKQVGILSLGSNSVQYFSYLWDLNHISSFKLAKVKRNVSQHLSIFPLFSQSVPPCPSHVLSWVAVDNAVVLCPQLPVWCPCVNATLTPSWPWAPRGW